MATLRFQNICRSIAIIFISDTDIFRKISKTQRNLLVWQDRGEIKSGSTTCQHCPHNNHCLLIRYWAIQPRFACYPYCVCSFLTKIGGSYKPEKLLIAIYLHLPDDCSKKTDEGNILPFSWRCLSLHFELWPYVLKASWLTYTFRLYTGGNVFFAFNFRNSAPTC